MDQNLTKKAITDFTNNFGSVESLLTFDEVILGIPIRHLERISASHDTAKITNPRLRVDAPLTMLRSIRQNESLSKQYEAMYNQCVVLAVSYFASAVKDIFIATVVSRIHSGTISDSDELTAQVPLALLSRHLDNIPALVGEILASQKDVSFQDMQSIARAFKRTVGYEPPRDTDVNDIITAQACRHAIVHDGGRVERRLVHQLRDANPRRIQSGIQLGGRVQFSPIEVRTIGTSMVAYLHGLQAGIAAKEP